MQPTAGIDAVKIDHALIPLIIRQSHAHRSGTKIDPAGIGARYLAAVGLPAYNSAFGKILADPMHGHLRFSPEELDAVRVVSAVQTERALNEGTGSAGLFAIPFTLDPSIVISNTGALNPYRAISRIETIATKEWRGVSSDGVIAAYVPEATESTDASPVLAQPTIKAEQGRAFIPFSLELGQDWNGIPAELARLVSDAKDVLDATKFTVGSGTNEPTGVLTGLAVGQRIQTLTVAVYALGDPWLLKAAIPARFAASSTFVANPAIWDATYRFIGGNSAEPLQMPSREGPFLGRPKVEASAMVSTTTTGSKIILVGDFQHFCIVDRNRYGRRTDPAPVRADQPAANRPARTVRLLARWLGCAGRERVPVSRSQMILVCGAGFWNPTIRRPALRTRLDLRRFWLSGRCRRGPPSWCHRRGPHPPRWLGHCLAARLGWRTWDGWQRVWSICRRRPASADDPHVPLALNSPRGTTF